MEDRKMNLFIIEEDPITIVNLRIYLKNRFGLKYIVFSFLTSNEAIRQVDADTNIVILDYDQGEVNGYEVYKSIKKLNPDTEVILLSTYEEIENSILKFENERNSLSFGKVKPEQIPGRSIFKFAYSSVDAIVNEFGVSKTFITFMLSFIFLGIALFITSFFII